MISALKTARPSYARSSNRALQDRRPGSLGRWGREVRALRGVCGSAG
jgi:hypothetical protein